MDLETMDMDDPEQILTLFKADADESSTTDLISSYDSLNESLLVQNSDNDRLASVGALLDDLIQQVTQDDSTLPLGGSQRSEATENVLQDCLTQGNFGNVSEDSSKDENSEIPVINTKELLSDGMASRSNSPKSPFQVSDGMKKGLSMLTFPTQGSHSRPRSNVRGLTSTSASSSSSHILSNSRITIGDLLGKMEDNSTDLASILSSSETNSAIQNTSLLSGSSVTAEAVLPGTPSRMEKSEVEFGEKENWRKTSSKSLKSLPPLLPIDRFNERIAETTTASDPGSRRPLVSKDKSLYSRTKLTNRMWNLLLFTFAHEHFPTSVYMARLAKMMGVQWSVIKNWFTNRRVENKKAGVFPRDKVLLHCPYCDMTLKTESEQKSHLFSTYHVKKILGPEYNGDADQNPIKWKMKSKGGGGSIGKESDGSVSVCVTRDNKMEPLALHKELKESSQKFTSEVEDSDETRSDSLERRWSEALLFQQEREARLGRVSNEAMVSAGKSKDDVVIRKIKDELVVVKVEDEDEKPAKTVTGNDVEKFRIKLPEFDKYKIRVPDKRRSLQSSPVYCTPIDEKPAKPITVEPVAQLCSIPVALSKRKNEKTSKVGPLYVCNDDLKEELKKQDETTFDKSMHNPPCQSGVDELEQELVKLCDAKAVINESMSPLTQPEKTSDVKDVMLRKDRIEYVKGKFVPKWENSLKLLEDSKPVKAELNSSLLPPVLKAQSVNANTKQNNNRRYSKAYNVNRMNVDESMIIGYQCPTCFKVYQSEWLLIKHTLVHLKFFCDICSQVFPSQLLLENHLLDHLTGAYEDEKYYCQFSCKICHSLKCECYEPIYCNTKEIPKAYVQIQKARRSKKTFITKPNSGPNDHLKVTLGSYKRLLNFSDKPEKIAMSVGQLEQISRQKSRMSSGCRSEIPGALPKPTQTGSLSSKTVYYKSENVRSGKASEDDNVLFGNQAKNDGKQELSFCGTEGTLSDGYALSTPSHTVKGNLQTGNTLSDVTTAKGPTRKGRKAGSKRTTSKLSNNYVYKDADYYYMCETCDASFLSKAELNEHMFFHRLKSRSRRGEKRGLSESVNEEEMAKKQKTEEDQCNESVQTITVGGFERFKCPLCKGHFASITDLNRHRTQAHKEGDITPENLPAVCSKYLKCNYCCKLYRRERELRRHLKHDCSAAPKRLKSKLIQGVTLAQLEAAGDGPHYIIVEKNIEEDTGLVQCTTSIHRGPIICIYCNMGTRREREMKRHIWQYCTKAPKSVVQKCKDGASLESLGFILEPPYEVSDKMDSSVNPSPISSPPDSIPSPTISQSQLPCLPLPTNSTSKQPLVCSYCGIWYFREVSLIKHMKESCINIPSRAQSLLCSGEAGICDNEIQAQSLTPYCPPKGGGIYKRVDIELGDGTENGDVKTSDCDSKDREKVNANPKTLPTPRRYGRYSKDKNPGRVSLRCRRCHEKFASSDAVLAHSSVHHGPKKGFYRCKLCNHKTPKYKQLREHVWLHTNETPYKCHVCKEKFRESEALIDHLQTKHYYNYVTEKNLYRWLPGRNGKYREIKNPEQAEETLEDMDTCMENMAEVMVITDQDIWTGRNHQGTSVDTTSVDDTSSQSSTSTQDDVLTNGSIQNATDKSKECNRSRIIIPIGRSLGVEDSTNSEKPNITKSLETIDKTKNKDSENDNKTVHVKSEESERIPKGSKLKIPVLEKETSCQGTSEDVLNIKVESENELAKTSTNLGDEDEELYSEEQLISGIDNLESVIETVQLTDVCLP